MNRARVVGAAASEPHRPRSRPDHGDRAAACSDIETPEIFFPDRSDPATEALSVCAGCLLVRECATYALSARERYGVWGGMTERDRELWWARQSRRTTVAKRRGA